MDAFIYTYVRICMHICIRIYLHRCILTKRYIYMYLLQESVERELCLHVHGPHGSRAMHLLAVVLAKEKDQTEAEQDMCKDRDRDRDGHNGPADRGAASGAGIGVGLGESVLLKSADARRWLSKSVFTGYPSKAEVPPDVFRALVVAHAKGC